MHIDTCGTGEFLGCLNLRTVRTDCMCACTVQCCPRQYQSVLPRPLYTCTCTCGQGSDVDNGMGHVLDPLGSQGRKAVTAYASSDREWCTCQSQCHVSTCRQCMLGLIVSAHVFPCVENTDSCRACASNSDAFLVSWPACA